VADVLGLWWSEGESYFFSFREGRLVACRGTQSDDRDAAVFDRLGPDRYRVRSGRECGEALQVVRDGEGRAVKLYWATYPFLREPV
jgi:hypothetical protein